MSELITTPNRAPIFFCSKPTDMRLGLPGLQKIIKQEAHKDPYKLGLYVFVSKDKHRVKIFWYQENGFAMFYKFVAASTFKVDHLSGAGYHRITAVNLSELLKGVPKRVRQ